MKDRNVEHPDRYRLEWVSGADNIADLIQVPGEIYDAGTFYNKANMLSDETAVLLGLDPLKDPTVNDAFQRIYVIKQPALYACDGVNIKYKFAGEMDFTEPWIWIRQRLAAHDISGLHIKDYFELTVKDNSGNPVTSKMQNADINHDLGVGDNEIIKYHIDFISKDLWPERHIWNKPTYNNGIADEQSPWLCSDIYAWLNSKEMDVPGAFSVNPNLTHVNYSTTGVYDKLPVSLQNIIIDRRSMLSVRFSAEGLLDDDNGMAWKSIGKLWLPNEIEVLGSSNWGSRKYSIGEAHQFPIFYDGKSRIKRINNTRYAWWTRTSSSGVPTGAVCIWADGAPGQSGTSYTSPGEPICFRISE